MNLIEMVDLKRQYAKIKSEIDAKMAAVIHEAAFIQGAMVKTFQQHLEEWLSVKHVIPCGNGTDALQIALMAAGLQPGDEVITVPFTFFATAEVIALLGLQPVFVDVEKDSFNMDVSQLEAAITPKTRAIIPVHLFGQCCDMENIMHIADKHHLFVIEDSCQAMGAQIIFRDGTKKHAGTIGHIGCTSFFPSKNLGCYGDGGALFTNDTQLAERAWAIANHGASVKYHHELIGINSRLDSLQAAVLDVKLNYLKAYTAARQQAAAFYDKAFMDLANIIIPAKMSYSTHVYHQYTIQLKGIDRPKLIEELKNRGIPSMIYYPIPLHQQKALQNKITGNNSFPVAETLCKSVLSLPMHTELDEEQLECVVQGVARGAGDL
ncbi:MAG: DegT/DnrJ/EryC1/StrS family aminotransferase [Bacteroidales bacterium]|jgi:dTDP-4-amino-4,6-dideoxygalactose transaminase|nr:DegT/DnrJ/EryC1/StrS family aminotransferase [Bacteroidales bacterium]